MTAPNKEACWRKEFTHILAVPDRFHRFPHGLKPILNSKEREMRTFFVSFCLLCQLTDLERLESDDVEVRLRYAKRIANFDIKSLTRLNMVLEKQVEKQPEKVK